LGNEFGIGTIIGLLVIFGLVSVGATFALHHLAWEMSRRKRLIIASLVGAFLPFSLPIFVIVVESSFDEEVIIIIWVLFIISLIAAIVICFPAVWFFTRWLERRGKSEITREPDLTPPSA